nr:MAG TPA: hypothetical protein [Caudoviricetes sp.]
MEINWFGRGHFQIVCIVLFKIGNQKCILFMMSQDIRT